MTRAAVRAPLARRRARSMSRVGRGWRTRRGVVPDYRGSVDSNTVVMGMVTTLPMEAMATTVTVMITATITVDTSTSR